MWKHINIDGTNLVCYPNGDIWRQNIKTKKWTKLAFKIKSYWQIRINGKGYLVNRLIANAFLGLDLKSKLVVDHINHNIHNNSIENLRIVTQQQNGFNRNAKGYCKISYTKVDGTESIYWGIQLRINGKTITKRAKTEEEARLGYLELKTIHHII